MELAVALSFRFFLYVLFGLTLEVLFAMHGIEVMLGYKLKRRVPFRYLEGFTSAYMIPLHGLGLLFGFELMHELMRHWFIGLRFVAWAVMITSCEVLWGLALEKTIGFYPWDYYAQSKYRVFKNGYTLWTLIPMWGLAGLGLEVYSDLLIYLSPYAVDFFLNIK